MDDKSNEITAILQLLQLLVVKGCLVTIDAMGCQTEIAEQVIDQGGDYLLAVKQNQGQLYEDIADLFNHATAADFAQEGFDQAHTVEKQHGRFPATTLSAKRPLSHYLCPYLLKPRRPLQPCTFTTILPT